MYNWYLDLSLRIKEIFLSESVNQIFTKYLKPLFYGGLLLLVFKFYLWTSFQGLPVILDPPGQSTNYYSRLTDAILHGQLHFLQLPPPELSKLKDPYDPIQNIPYRLHDASLYKGKWYIYFGLTPVILLWLPARAIGLSMNDPFAVAIFCWVGLLASLGFLKNIIRLAKLNVASWQWGLITVLLSIGNSIPYLLRRPAMYEVAISAAYCCSMLALFFLSSSYNLNRVAKRYLVLGSAFLALSVGARPNFIIWFIVLLTASILLLMRPSIESKVVKVKEQIAIWFPYISIGSLLAIYNYLRFDSFVEFGSKYVLAGVHMQKIKQFSMESLWPGLYFNVWQPLFYDHIFPFVHVKPHYPGKLPKEYIGPEPIAGMFSIAPFLFFISLIFILFYYGRNSQRTGNNRIATFVLSVLILLGFIQLLLISVVFPSATMRYLMDFIPVFLLSVTILWLALDMELVFRKLRFFRRSINILAAVLIIWGGLSNLGIGMTGYYDNFKSANIDEYLKLKKLMMPTGKSVTYKLVVNIFDSAAVSEPILYLGTTSAADLVFIERDKNQYRLGIDHWGTAPQFSEWHQMTNPGDIKISVNAYESMLEVKTSNITLVSSTIPYNPFDSPVIGKNDIGFSTLYGKSTSSILPDENYASYNFALKVTDSKVTAEPIAYWGVHNAADLVFIEREKNRYRIGIDHWGSPSTFSNWHHMTFPSKFDVNVIAYEKFLEVRTSDISMISPYTPHKPFADPVVGVNDIGFTTTGKKVTTVVTVIK